MAKDFRKWHTKKEHLNETRGSALFHEREVWWCTYGVNIGYEQDGSGELFTRPAVILSKFNLDACLVVPLTTRPKKGKYYFSLGKIGEHDAVAVLSQIRFVDRKRLAMKITTIDQEVFQTLTKAVVQVCFPRLNL